MKTNLIITTVLMAMLLIGSCKKETKEEDRPCPNCPYIESISPDHGSAYDTVYLHGQNFSNRPESNYVTINNKECVVTDVDISDTLLKIIVPERVGSGNVHIKVNDNELLSNQDNWVQANWGVPPYFDYEESFNISSAPVATLPGSYLFSILVDSLYIYYDSNDDKIGYLDLSVSSSLSPVVIYDVAPDFPYTNWNIKFMSQSYYRSGNLIYFYIRGTGGSSGNTYPLVQQYTFDVNTKTVSKNSSYKGQWPVKQFGFVPAHYLESGSILFYTIDGSGTGNPTTEGVNFYSESVYSNSLDLTSPQASFTKSQLTSKNLLQWRVYSMEEYATNKIIGTSEENSESFFWTYDVNSRTLSSAIGAGMGNYPASVGQEVALDQARIGQGVLSKYDDKVFYCDGTYGKLLELDVANNKIKVIKNLPGFSGNDIYFRILYSPISESAVLLKQDSNTGETEIYYFNYE